MKLSKLKSGAQCVAIMSIMRDTVVGKEGGEKTSRKASFMKPANPAGEFQ